MIDPCSPLRRLEHVAAHTRTGPLLASIEPWRASAGLGVVAGLVDGGYDEMVPDQAGAKLVGRDFTDSPVGGVASEHGTYSVTTLVGQGRHQIRGLVPQARLLVAKVVNVDGIATPHSVAEAIDWLVACGAQVVAIPLGEPVERAEIAQRIEQGSERGVIFVRAEPVTDNHAPGAPSSQSLRAFEAS